MPGADTWRPGPAGRAQPGGRTGWSRRRGHRQGHPAHPSRPLLVAIYQPALATGFARAFLVAAGIAVPGLLIEIAATRSAAPTSPAPPRPAPAVPAESAQPRQPRQRHVR